MLSMTHRAEVYCAMKRQPLRTLTCGQFLATNPSVQIVVPSGHNATWPPTRLHKHILAAAPVHLVALSRQIRPREIESFDLKVDLLIHGQACRSVRIISGRVPPTIPKRQGRQLFRTQPQFCLFSFRTMNSATTLVQQYLYNTPAQSIQRSLRGLNISNWTLTET